MPDRGKPKMGAFSSAAVLAIPDLQESPNRAQGKPAKGRGEPKTGPGKPPHSMGSCDVPRRGRSYLSESSTQAQATSHDPEGTKRATSVNVQLPCLQKDLRTGSISRDIVSFPSELCRRRRCSRMSHVWCRSVDDSDRTRARGSRRAAQPSRGV